MTAGSEALRRDAEAARDALLQAHVAAAGEGDLAAVAARVGAAVAEAEAAGERTAWAERFAALLGSGRFWPSVPILANAGRADGQLAACFVLEAQDSLGSIYDTLARAARIQQGSGGVGIDLSGLRPHGAAIERSGGVSPGPVAFAELTAHSARVNALAGRREGAHLVILADTHPDILAFVEAAREVEALRGAGLAVATSGALLDAARRDAPHPLCDPRGKPAGSVSARALLEAIAAAIRDTGNPTLLFLDAMAAGNPVPHLGPLRATNPCGEQPLLPGESCVLGSLVLPTFADASGAVDFDALAAATREAVRFLDDVVDATCSPDRACEEATGRTRKIGLGVMGFADLLLLRGERYGSPESERTAQEVIARIAREARSASEALAGERGAFPAFEGPGAPRRNASLLAVAPTGTLRLLAGSSAGLEPWIAPVVRVRPPGGDEVRWIDRWLLDWLETGGTASAAVVDALEAGLPSDALPGLGPAERALLRRADEVPPEQQLALQACFQAHVDGAVSKTVHLPAETSAGHVVALIHRAHALGCKGAAFWRATTAPAPCVSCVS
ncbi:MAG: ribonucleotide reductase N-terminal alpha domain-containing protein [Myxococcota bacterium]